jgi:cellulose biosynthesis protein BcsQ
MGKVIAVVNQKGGVGKSTTAVNLSACMADGGTDVLLVDIENRRGQLQKSKLVGNSRLPLTYAFGKFLLGKAKFPN